MFKQIRTKGQTTIYTENKRSNSTNPTKNWGGGTQVLRTGDSSCSTRDTRQKDITTRD